ncbi:hypothetical protein Efla_000282 [Eimeria flavescens]
MELFKVRCPMNCAAAEFALTEGSSIHPGSSSVCAAAEIDGVASASGGVLVVTVVGPLPEYSPTGQSAAETEAVSQTHHSVAPNATTTSVLHGGETDSIDDIVSNIRVVDGKPLQGQTCRPQVITHLQHTASSLPAAAWSFVEAECGGQSGALLLSSLPLERLISGKQAGRLRGIHRRFCAKGLPGDR